MTTPKGSCKSRRHTSGFTLVELTLSLSVFSVISIAAGQSFLTFSTSVTRQVQEAHLASRTQVVMDRLLDEMVTGQFVTMDPPIPDTSNWIRFERPIDFVGTAVVYGNPIQIDLVTNGESQSASLRIWEDIAPLGTSPSTEDNVSIVARNVVTDGLVFNRFGSIIEINLTMFDQIEDYGPPELLTIVSGVRMRNSE